MSKPPPKGQKIKVEEKAPTQPKEIDNLTAPPTFKRKGTSTNTTKSKKVKE